MTILLSSDVELIMELHLFTAIEKITPYLKKIYIYILIKINLYKKNHRKEDQLQKS